MTTNAPTEVQANLARIFHQVRHHADASALRDVLASLDQPAMPPEVEARITAALKEARRG